MGRNGNHRNDDFEVGKWQHINEWIKSPRGIGTILTFAAVWAITAFNPVVGLGLGIGLIGVATRFSRRRALEDREFELYRQQSEFYAQKPTTAIVNTTAKAEPPIHLKVIEDAEGSLKEVRAAANVASGEVGKSLREIVRLSEDMAHHLRQDSSKLSEVQRVFTYYIPSTSALLTARGKALLSNDDKKVAEVDNMISRLELAFKDFNARMNGEDTRSIDIDIKLLDQSLKQDLPIDLYINNNEKIHF